MERETEKEELLKMDALPETVQKILSAIEAKTPDEGITQLLALEDGRRFALFNTPVGTTILDGYFNLLGGFNEYSTDGTMARFAVVQTSTNQKEMHLLKGVEGQPLIEVSEYHAKQLLGDLEGEI